MTRRLGETTTTSNGVDEPPPAQVTWLPIVSRSTTPNTSDAKQPG
ncbi:hypothetical protein [Streptomyces sp. NPDC048277]